MRCGDLTATQLKTQYRLNDVSDRVDPYTLTTKSPKGYVPAFGSLGVLTSSIALFKEEEITKQQCVKMLFDEFRQLSSLFSFYGPYKHLIEKMISHMQYGNGRPFHHLSLDSALKEHILHDKTENSTLARLEEVIGKNIDWKNKCYPEKEKNELRKAILKGKLPKFDRIQDNINGMGITVHDTWATHVTINSLKIEHGRYRALVHYQVQDHFGLDSDDISKSRFNQLRLFRIWFVLQRYHQFAFKPFMTNMSATVEIIGKRNEGKK